MADLQQLETALRNADAAGDVSAAQFLAGEIMKARGSGDGLSADNPAKKPPAPYVPSGERKGPDSVFDTSPEMLAGNPLTRFATGAASPFLGLAQLASHLQQPLYEKVGIPLRPADTMDELIRRNAELREQGRAAQGDEGLDVEHTAGAVLAPTNMLFGKVPAAATLPGRVKQGAVVGAAAGAATPVESGDFADTKATQIGLGAGAGAVLPVATAALAKGGKMLYHGLVEPVVNPAAIKGRAYLEAAGDKVDDIIELLTRNKQIVPGSRPTAGEAAEPASRAEFSALQESAKKAAPSAYFGREEGNNQARIDALREFAGNPAKRAAAVADRTAAAGPHYELGESQRLPFDVLQFGELAKRPSTRAAITRAQRLIEEETGQKVKIPDMVKDQTVTGAEAQKIKLAFDDLIKLFPKSGMDSAELEAIKNTRGAYIKWMEENFPALREARTAYKAASAPINQMDVGEALVEKLTPALREEAKQRAGVFAGAVRDSASTIKKATGEPRFTKLEDVLTGRQLQTVHNVQDDLARSSRHMELARAGGKAGPNALDLATGNLEREAGGKMPNLLHRGAMLANAIITRLEGRVNKRLAAEMAAEMLDPPKVGESLAAAKARALRAKVISEAIHRQLNAAIAGGVTAAGQTQGE